MVAATALKLLRQGHLQWHDLHTEFHHNLQIRSLVERTDRQTHRQDGDLISLHVSFRKESRLKISDRQLQEKMKKKSHNSFYSFPNFITVYCQLSRYELSVHDTFFNLPSIWFIKLYALNIYTEYLVHNSGYILV